MDESTRERTVTIKSGVLYSAVAGGFVRAFQGADNNPEAEIIRRMIDLMDNESWRQVIDSVVEQIAEAGEVEGEDPKVTIARLMNEVERDEADVTYYGRLVDQMKERRRENDLKVLNLMKKVEAEEHTPEWWRAFFAGRDKEIARSCSRVARGQL